jgi:hypothetical protein
MTTTDPEYDRLRDAVVEAAMHWHQDEYGINGPGSALDTSCKALRDYRTKSPSPAPTCNDSLQVRGQPDGLPDAAESCPACGALPCDWVNDPLSPPPDPVPLRVEPPEEFQIGDIVEANLPRFEINPVWHVARVTAIRGDGYGVEFFGRAGEFDLKKRHIRRAHSPCKPDTRIADPIAGEFTDEDAAKVGRSLMAAIDANSDHPLLKDWTPAEDPAEIVADLLWAFDQPKFDTRIEPTDEAIDALWVTVDWDWNKPRTSILRLVRKAVSHFSPTQPADLAAEAMSKESLRVQSDYLIPPNGPNGQPIFEPFEDEGMPHLYSRSPSPAFWTWR